MEQQEEITYIITDESNETCSASWKKIFVFLSFLIGIIIIAIFFYYLWKGNYLSFRNESNQNNHSPYFSEPMDIPAQETFPQIKEIISTEELNVKREGPVSFDGTMEQDDHKFFDSDLKSEDVNFPEYQGKTDSIHTVENHGENHLLQRMQKIEDYNSPKRCVLSSSLDTFSKTIFNTADKLHHSTDYNTLFPTDKKNLPIEKKESVLLSSEINEKKDTPGHLLPSIWYKSEEKLSMEDHMIPQDLEVSGRMDCLMLKETSDHSNNKNISIYIEIPECIPQEFSIQLHAFIKKLYPLGKVCNFYTTEANFLKKPLSSFEKYNSIYQYNKNIGDEKLLIDSLRQNIYQANYEQLQKLWPIMDVEKTQDYQEKLSKFLEYWNKLTKENHGEQTPSRKKLLLDGMEKEKKNLLKKIEEKINALEELHNKTNREFFGILAKEQGIILLYGHQESTSPNTVMMQIYHWQLDKKNKKVVNILSAPQDIIHNQDRKDVHILEISNHGEFVIQDTTVNFDGFLKEAINEIPIL